jgi:hypothetical protein
MVANEGDDLFGDLLREPGSSLSPALLEGLEQGLAAPLEQRSDVPVQLEVFAGRSEPLVVEVKIPHETKEWLAATDDGERRYRACHCPWVKESFRQDDVEVPASFCSCSAGFHKRFWEVVLDQPLEAEILESVLAGDDRCAIAIRLPADFLDETGG